MQLHTKSSHLVDALVIGPSRWTARELLFGTRLEVAFVLVPGDDEFILGGQFGSKVELGMCQDLGTNQEPH